jgi:hypothetical protein
LAIDYTGAYSNIDFNSVGDVVGTLIDDIQLFSHLTSSFEFQRQ